LFLIKKWDLQTQIKHTSIGTKSCIFRFQYFTSFVNAIPQNEASLISPFKPEESAVYTGSDFYTEANYTNMGTPSETMVAACPHQSISHHGSKDLPSLQGGALMETLSAEASSSPGRRQRLHLPLAGAASGPSKEAREGCGGARHGALRRLAARKRRLRNTGGPAAALAGELC
jgi:hypothetical protein